jgi:hypothetical protein
VADFYREFMETLDSLRIAVKIWPMPVEVANPIRLDHDRTHASYAGIRVPVLADSRDRGRRSLEDVAKGGAAEIPSEHL